jgi:hypothetical protein
MAGSRTLKLSILGDVDNLRKSLNEGTQDVQTFGNKIGDFSKKAGLAFAAAGAAAVAYAGKLAIDGVKSAIADEAAQKKLELTLRNVAGATRAQTQAVEAYITKTQLAYGVTDTELRPSLERLARATGSVTEAQKLQAVALDVAAGSGKSLEAVTNAMAKAAEGNTGALAKLGVGLSAAQLKTLSMDEITKKLADTFENQAAAKADTFEGKLARLTQAFDESKETVGVFILDAITPLVTIFIDKVVPALQTIGDNICRNFKAPLQDVQKFIVDFVIPALQGIYNFIRDFIVPIIVNIFRPALEGLLGAFNSVRRAINDNEADLQPLYNLFRAVAGFVRDNVAPAIGTILKTAFDVLGTALSAIIRSLSSVVNFLDNMIDKVKDFIALVRANPIVSGISGLIDRVFGGGRAAGGPVNAGTTYLVGEKGPELFTPGISGNIIPNHKISGGSGGGATFNITVNGALDPEGVARTIVNVLNNSSYRGTLGSGAFA